MASTQVAGQGKKLKENCPLCGKVDTLKTTLVLNFNKGQRRKEYIRHCEGCEV